MSKNKQTEIITKNVFDSVYFTEMFSSVVSFDISVCYAFVIVVIMADTPLYYNVNPHCDTQFVRLTSIKIVLQR